MKTSLCVIIILTNLIFIRVLQRNGASSDRLSFPFFYDPSFDAEMISVEHLLSDEDKALAQLNREQNSFRRWDNRDPSQFRGTYGQYLLGKVMKAFPQLSNEVL